MSAASETTTVTIVHDQDAEPGIIAAVEACLDGLDHIHEYVIS